MIYVRIDVASDKHDFMLMTENGSFYTRRSITIPNNDEGYKKLHNSITKFCRANNDYQVRIGFESTGFYHLNLLLFLLMKEYKVYLLNPILTNMFKNLNKFIHQRTTTYIL